MMNFKIKSAGLAALSAAVLLTGCGKLDQNATLVTIKNGDTTDTISLGYGNFAARYQQSMYDQFLLSYYGEGMWSSDMTGSGSTMQDETKDNVLDEIENQYLAKAHAADYNVSLTDDQKKAIADAAAKFISDNPEETIKEMGATEDIVKEYLENRTYYTLVEKAAKEAADPDISEKDTWMRSFTYVLFDTNGKKDEDGNTVEYTEEEIANLKSQAEDLSKSEDFDKDAEKLGVTTSKFSYLKGEKEDDTMDMKIIKAAEKLNEGDVSSVIEIEDVGYYVLRLDKDHDEDASANKRSALQTEAFTKLLDTWKAEITWTVDEDQWKKVEFDTLFKAPEKEEEESTETTESTEATTETTTEETVEDDSEKVEETTEETTEETEETTEEQNEDSTEETAEESDAE
ncbi:foldase protein PrsA [Pseudobutyrivibrio sp. ACV-2]|uniref:hypothetical protein n=1 Tax=Pseudobutyrivibrio sp. ACV-2 TaxID=1520801 RepID=UPI0008974BC3|nr:hypothetical protein [Pseudobutyrivibrio sp. ACV-2]SEA11631.1 foldase protein PrsA [Pseudobutyrivibrio sp. ACV-2]